MSEAERARTLPGDDLLGPHPCIVMDRATTLPAAPVEVWPWLVQLGKGRAGWYFPAAAERLLPPRGRGLRHLDPGLDSVRVGDRVPDWGPGDPEFRAELVDAPRALVWLSLRDRHDGWRWPADDRRADHVLALTWALVLSPVGDSSTRLHLRVRIPRRGRLAPLVEVGGGLVDALTVALLFAGLRERLAG